MSTIISDELQATQLIQNVKQLDESIESVSQYAHACLTLFRHLSEGTIEQINLIIRDSNTFIQNHPKEDRIKDDVENLKGLLASVNGIRVVANHAIQARL